MRRGQPHPGKGRHYPPEFLRRDEIEGILRETASLRDRALLVVLWRTGMRISEALRLRPDDWYPEDRTLRVLWGKGGKQRTLALDRKGAEVLEDWLRARQSFKDPSRYLDEVGRSEQTPQSARPTIFFTGAPIFCTRTGRVMDPSNVRLRLQAAARRAGITRRVHPHIFRHTFTVELVRAGVPDKMIQQLLGHARLTTTDLYTRSLSPEGALEKLRDRDDW